MTTVTRRPAAWYRPGQAPLNRAALTVLRSPLHHLVDTQLCELSYRAPRSGRPVRLPVIYAPDGADLVVIVGEAAEKTWWRSFRRPHPVRVYPGDRAGTGRLLAATDPRYAAAVDAYERRHGIRPAADDRVVLIEHLTAPDSEQKGGAATGGNRAAGTSGTNHA